MMVRILIDWWFDEGGATAIEYAMIASAISIAIAAVVFGLGESVSGIFTNASAGFS